MPFDPKVPPLLKEIELWFADIITEPLIELNTLKNNAGAEKYLKPSKTRSPDKRIEIYAQQYWWRLIHLLHEIFPATTRFLGYKEFNTRLAIPYLAKTIPQNWSLIEFGKTLPKFAKTQVNTITHHLTTLDLAYNTAFFAADVTPLNTLNLSPEALFEQPVQLAPSLHLLSFPYDLPKFRRLLCQQEPDFWSQHHAASQDQKTTTPIHSKPIPSDPHYFALYRTNTLAVTCKELPKQEYEALLALQKGGSIAEFVNHFEQTNKELPPLDQWITRWMHLHWIGTQSN